MTPQLTLNLGVRYDVDINLIDQPHYDAERDPAGARGDREPERRSAEYAVQRHLTASRLRLRPVGRRAARAARRRRHLLGSVQHQRRHVDIFSQNQRPLNVLATLTNTAIGVGALATYRFGIDPIPAQPTEANTLPLGSNGQWLVPSISNPRTHQAHIGYAHRWRQTRACRLTTRTSTAGTSCAR